MFVLDTCIVSELRKSRSQADPGLIGWADGVPATEMYLSTMSLHELDLAPLADSLILIAATALAHDMALVTRNVADFDRFVGLLVINPFET